MLYKTKIFILFFVFYSVSKASCLIEAKNSDLLFANCLRCHSDKLICQQSLSKKDWDKTLLWMEEKHNLEFASKKIRENILAYLEKYYGIKNQHNKHPMAQRPTNPLPPEK